MNKEYLRENTYELRPYYDNHKSFYGKAIVTCIEMSKLTPTPHPHPIIDFMPQLSTKNYKVWHYKYIEKYGRDRVLVRCLYSYDTLIAVSVRRNEYKNNNTLTGYSADIFLTEYWNYSATTLRHLKEFIYQENQCHYSKKEIEISLKYPVTARENKGLMKIDDLYTIYETK